MLYKINDNSLIINLYRYKEDNDFDEKDLIKTTDIEIW